MREMIENGMAKEEDIRGFASIIRKEAGRLLTLISDIIQLSELDDPEGAMRLERVDLLELALECEAILALPAEARNITFTVIGGPAIDRRPGHARSSSTTLRQRHPL